MSLLLDTRILIWLLTSSSRLQRSERALIEDSASQVIVSILSIWEIRMKWEARDRTGARRSELSPQVAANFVEAAGFATAPVTLDLMLTPLTPDIDHLDPFDRMLLTHAQHLGARLLTRDRMLVTHPVALVA